MCVYIYDRYPEQEFILFSAQPLYRLTMIFLEDKKDQYNNNMFLTSFSPCHSSERERR